MLPVLSYLMWSLHWNVTDIRTIDHQACKIVSENRGKHPLGSTALIYLLRADGGRGLTKVKGALELYSNTNPTMELVRKFEEHAADKGHPSLVKEATRFSEEMGHSYPSNFIPCQKANCVLLALRAVVGEFWPSNLFCFMLLFGKGI